MRSPLLSSLIIAGFAGQVLGVSRDHQAKRRKTLGFGALHPHAVFRTTPYQITTNGILPLDPNTDPFEVADHFLTDTLANQLSETNTYAIRKDSYTDQNT